MHTKCKTSNTSIFLFFTLLLSITFSFCQADDDINIDDDDLHEEYFTFILKSNGKIPSCAIEAGLDMYEKKLYAGRAPYEGDLIPAKVAPHLGGAFVPYGFKEYYITNNYEVYCAPSESVTWIPSSNGDVPSNAIVFGETSKGEKLYMGRAIFNGYPVPGKIQPSLHLLFIPYNRKEFSFSEYEVLVRV